jgi:cephalosporin-C deacetylase-like acetyl esterase
MRMIRRIITLVLGLTLVVVAAYSIYLAVPRYDYFLERSGTLVEAEVIEEQREFDRSYSVHLKSSTGLEVDMRVLRPEVDVTEKLPVVVVLGGQETGKDAIDLVGPADGIVFAAIDYPYDGSQDLDGFWKSVYAIPAVQRAFLDSPPAVSLALSWLLQQDYIDADKAELAGVSLGVPFATAAGALDERFSRVWMLHGGGDNVSWVSHNARRHIDNVVLRHLTARTVLFIVHGRSFETQRWIPEIAPRPVIIVAAKNDDYVPPEAQKPLVNAARADHVELIWTEGRHIGPSRGDELEQLLIIVRDRILGAERRLSGPVHPIEPLDWSGPEDKDLVALPSLNDIDAFLRLELVDTFGSQLDALLASDAMVDRIVATIDNLPRSHVAERVRPVGRIASNFAVAESGSSSAIDPANYERYRVLVDMFTLADPDTVNDLYRRYYPLLQKSYESLGYPNAYFNDRVVEVIDHLLATPIPDEPPRLVRPHVLYEFENPEYEALSSGQKFLLRMGEENAARTKSALEELRARITS